MKHLLAIPRDEMQTNCKGYLYGFYVWCLMIRDSSSFRSALYIQQSLYGNNRRGFLAVGSIQQNTRLQRISTS